MTSTQIDREERGFELAELERWSERPLRWLGLVWLALLVIELIYGATDLLTTLSTAIWVIFVVDFVVRLAIAPERLAHLRRNWFTLISVLVPALRFLRFLRVLRFVRVGVLARVLSSLRLVRVVSAVNRAMRSLRGTLARRRFGYVIALTAIVIVAGAAAMLAFERHVDDPRGIHDFSTALWWTAMLVITMGTDYWPVTLEGRALSFFLALYGFAVLGYITATLATYFLGRDAQENERRSPVR